MDTKHPTPWRVVGSYIYDANDRHLFTGDIELLRQIVRAVNFYAPAREALEAFVALPPDPRGGGLADARQKARAALAEKEPPHDAR